jgi:hypothetical protein
LGGQQLFVAPHIGIRLWEKNPPQAKHRNVGHKKHANLLDSQARTINPEKSFRPRKTQQPVLFSVFREQSAGLRINQNQAMRLIPKRFTGIPSLCF